MKALVRTFAATALLAAPALAQNAAVLWNDAALAAIRATNTPPPRASRNLAILYAAVFDAANGIRPAYDAYLVAPTAPSSADRTAAVASAGHAVLIALWPTQAANFTTVRDGLLASVTNPARRQQGIAWGDAVALQILSARATDGADAVLAYPGSTTPGMWRPTVSFGGNVLPALLPHWGYVTPFAVADVSALQPEPPPALASAEYAAEVGVTQAIGRSTSSTRTAEQTEIARFWAYGPNTATPPGHWNDIARDIAIARHLDLVESARMFALLNFAMADAAIACWRAKYDIGLWRPITAIQLADQDGNAATTADPSWTPLLPTPPFPEYTSGHSTFSAAAASVLARFFRTDAIAFSARSDDLPGVVRNYVSFSQAAYESGLSRIYGGIHFPSGNSGGLQVGVLIGREVAATKLRRRGSN